MTHRARFWFWVRNKLLKAAKWAENRGYKSNEIPERKK